MDFSLNSADGEPLIFTKFATNQEIRPPRLQANGFTPRVSPKPATENSIFSD